MGRTILSLRRIVAVLLVLSVGAIAVTEGRELVRSDFVPLAPGLEYCHETRADGPLSIHVLRIDRLGHRWDLQTGLGAGTVFGLEPLDGIVRRASTALGQKPLAAVNGDFFVIKPGPYQGDPRGIQIANRELVSTPAGNSLWVSADGDLKIGPIRSELSIEWPDGKTRTPLGLNEARSDNAVVLYSPTLGIRPNGTPKEPPRTRTQGGRELILDRYEGQPWLPIEAGKTYAARVREVRDSGNTPLAPGLLILSIGPQALRTVPTVKPGEVVRLIVETRPDLSGVKTAIGGGRILIQDGKTPNVGPPNQPRHPRSMIGWNRHHLFFFVIDGRQPGLSIGMTYPEMAALAKDYGCTDAIELDGGGSSTLWAMGRIWNSPSDGRPRAIANGLILFREARTPGVP